MIVGNRISHKTNLINYTIENNLEQPTYKSTGYLDKISNKMLYVARVKVAGHSIVSHGTYSSPDDAEEEAAKNAFQVLKNKRLVGKQLTNCQEKEQRETIIKNITSV